MKKASFNKLLEILLRPFTKHFLFLIAFFVLATSPSILLNIEFQGFALNTIFVIAHCFVLSYLVTILISLIKPDIVRKVIQGILMVVSAIYFAVNFYCLYGLGYILDNDIVMLILGSDFNEAREFASVMLPKWIIVSILGILLVFIALAVLSRKHRLNLGKKASRLALVGTGLCVAVNASTWDVWGEGPIHYISSLMKYEQAEDLTAYYTHPKLTIQDESQLPCNVVLIIGESFARSHSSLYGYDKVTNPHLSALRDSSLLFTFDSIDAPAPTTAESMRFMLSAFSKADDKPSNDKRWFEYTTIIELIQDCGYDCYWFGNQARGSKNNSANRVFAEACQHQKFLQQEGSEHFNVNLDIVLVDSSSQYVHNIKPQEHHFIIYHMMGSHFDFSMRYPKEFARFKEADYADQPADHRSTLAAFDNSIFYNDYVVDRIMSLYKDKEAIVIYLPDHGQVMYRNPQKSWYFAHGNPQDPVSYALGVEIPFFIYASPLYQQKHPETMERIKNRQAHPKAWNADDLPYFIMDLIGVTAINGQDTRDKSVLN